MIKNNFPDEMKVAITTLNKDSGDILSYSLTDNFYLSCMNGENIINNKQHKTNIIEELKKDFIELITGCTILFVDDYIDYRKDGNLLFYYQKNEHLFGFEYEIWLHFKSKHQLKYIEMKDLLAGVVEDVLNYKKVTPNTVIVYSQETV